MSVVVLAYHEMGFMGLRTLLRRGADVTAVFTYDDHPGENCWFGSVAQLAQSRGIATYKTETINDPEGMATVARHKPDVMFSFYYRDMIKRPLRELPRLGCFNLHGSLLPKFRGRSPLNWQLVHGVTESGSTLHHMVARADAGDIVGHERVAVDPDDTAYDLYQKLLVAGEHVLDAQLDAILAGRAPRRVQDEAQATVFGGRKPEDGRIHWERTSAQIHDLVRAVAPPWPGAFSDSPEGRTWVWQTRRVGPEMIGALPRRLAPGAMIESKGKTFAGTGDGALELVLFHSPGRSPGPTPKPPAIVRGQGAAK